MTAALNETNPVPDYLDDLLREQHLKLLFWRVGDTQRVNEDIPEAGVVADLDVIFTNGKRYFRSIVVLDTDVIYGLVGQDDISIETAMHAVGEILGHAKPFPAALLDMFTEDEGYAEALSTWEHSDAEIIRRAAFEGSLDSYTLFSAIADLVEQMPEGLSHTDPLTRIAHEAVNLAWEVL